MWAIACFYLRLGPGFLLSGARLFHQIAAALKAGGIPLFQTYTREQLKLGGRPTHPMDLLENNEPLGAFASLQILHHQETLPDKAVAELVAPRSS